MVRSSRVSQAYGYAVCLIAVVTILIGVGNLTDAFIERANPLMADGRYGSLTSFEAYRTSEDMHRPAQPRVNAGDAAAPDTLTTAKQRARYEALRADQLPSVPPSCDRRRRCSRANPRSRIRGRGAASRANEGLVGLTERRE